jgi:hypothetical protein
MIELIFTIHWNNYNGAVLPSLGLGLSTSHVGHNTTAAAGGFCLCSSSSSSSISLFDLVIVAILYYTTEPPLVIFPRRSVVWQPSGYFWGRSVFEDRFLLFRPTPLGDTTTYIGS